MIKESGFHIYAGFAGLKGLITTFLELGGEFTLCSTCAESLCGLDANQAFEKLVIREEVQIQGFASMVHDAKKSTTLTF